MTFRPSGTPGTGTVMWMDFMRRNDDKIVTVDQTGRAILYDPVTHTVRALPTMVTPKSWNLSLAVGDDLYVMETIPWPDKDGSGKCRRSVIEALIHCEERRPNPNPNGGIWKEGDDCFWRPLPPPPCVHAAGYRGLGAGEICGYAAVGNSHILVSTMSYGTYSFDTASSAWRKAGDWKLPFLGRAEYVPEHGIWFGFSAVDDGVLGAWDLSSTVKQQQQQPPLVVHSGCDGFTVPEAHVSHVIHLGAGKLCIAKLFMVDRRETLSKSCSVSEGGDKNFTMLTGVEVVRGCSDKLHIIKHKSCRYSFGEHDTPVSVL
uniref:F-box associated domain-containing protein n=2 Tax=Oryza TaxID=4527 RepID=A0A0D3F0A9_9ORYZ